MKKVILLGESGLIGGALAKKLGANDEFTLTKPSSKELNLLNSDSVESYFAKHKPDLIINAAGKCGGVAANIKMPGDFSLENTIISASVFNAAIKTGVSRIIHFIPACIYPANAPLPYSEESILNGAPEESSRYFAVAKLNALFMAEALNKQHKTSFISVIPSNVYGPCHRASGDHSHVIPSLIKKMAAAKNSNSSSVEIWGNGTNQRDFLHVEDLAEATYQIMMATNPPPVINVGSGEVTTIENLARIIQSHVGYTGKLEFSDNGLSGAQHKYVDTSKIKKLGWTAKVFLRDGIKSL
ncbi:NAD-dependent epimerase/dehydratase family protein [Bdellovibrio sp. HCB288]|uniref:NAD-dependent epimerase/dehydratase family protein n=1 Tax=Bdellovibrio sp. HCB288 TaxID=3394355 RepID=UPI0039B42E4C